VSDEGRQEASAHVLGDVRVQRLAALQEQAEALSDLTKNAFGFEMTLLPLNRSEFAKLRASSARSSESWVFTASESKGRYLAMDEASDSALLHPAEATIYTPIHTQLVSWWLFHAWRSLDLILNVITSLYDWHPYIAAVTSRAVIEQAGCLLYESRKIADGWTAAKTFNTPDEFARINEVRNLLTPLLTSVAFGTRLSAMEGRGLRATNVLTYVDKLAAATGESEIRSWYDWLSDAAHPAFGARIAGSSDPLIHDTRAVLIRYHDRSPLHLVGRDGVSQFQYPIVAHAADAVTTCGSLTFKILNQMLEIVDDFGLTTAAATYTTRDYWRNFTPTRGNRQCQCGRGSWARCAHWWGGRTPELHIEPTST
jgi:hypothetical protein